MMHLDLKAVHIQVKSIYIGYFMQQAYTQCALKVITIHDKTECERIKYIKNI